MSIVPRHTSEPFDCYTEGGEGDHPYHHTDCCQCSSTFHYGRSTPKHEADAMVRNHVTPCHTCKRLAHSKRATNDRGRVGDGAVKNDVTVLSCKASVIPTISEKFPFGFSLALLKQRRSCPSTCSFSTPSNDPEKVYSIFTTEKYQPR